MKFLIAQTLFLGDTILSLPLAQRLKETVREAEIDFLVDADVAGILENHPAVSSVIPFDRRRAHIGIRGILTVSRELRKRRYDSAIVLPGSVWTAFSVFLARIPKRIGSDQSSGMLLFHDMVKFPSELKRPLRNRVIYLAERLWKLLAGSGSFVSIFFTEVVRLRRDVHVAQRYLALLEPLGIASRTAEPPRLYPDREDKQMVDSLIGAEQRERVGVAPGSVWQTKRWPAENYSQLITQLQKETTGRKLQFVLVGGVDDVPLCKQIHSEVGDADVLDCSGKLTVLQSAELIGRCRVLVTNDAAPMHLASAMGTPCVAIYGPTVPAFGFVPFGNEYAIIESGSLWCRPCTPHGGHRCPIGTHVCMREISVNLVFDTVTKFLRLAV